MLDPDKELLNYQKPIDKSPTKCIYCDCRLEWDYPGEICESCWNFMLKTRKYIKKGNK